jgi:cytochrome c-type biogenesis protein CcmH
VTVFWSIAVLLAVVALAFVLPALLGRRGATRAATPDAANVALHRDQLRELDADLAAGTLSPEQRDEARREIEQRLLDDVRAGNDTRAIPAGGRRTAWVVAAAVPVAALLLYFAVGNPAALAPGAAAGDGHGVTRQQIEGMVERLAARMKENPDDAEGWAMLGRSYAVLDRHVEAAAAYANAVKRAQPDAQLLADYADVLAMARGRNLKGEPERLIAQALKLDPRNVKALLLAGTVAFQDQKFKDAIAYWERILKVVQPDSAIADSVHDSIADARKLAGGGAKPEPARLAAPAPAAVSGTVSLAPALASKAAPDDTVFIFARPAEGPRMPLAVLRKRVRDLPTAFTLDEAMAMTPAASLSNHSQVVVGARVSKSGSPAPQPGDLEGLSAPVPVGKTGIAITIDREVGPSR